MIVTACICLVLMSLIGLIVWFFYSIEVAQKRIDNESE